MVSMSQLLTHKRGILSDNLRLTVLTKIGNIFREFVRIVSLRNGLPVQLAEEAGGTIFTFGSFRLGVHGQGGLL
jgi:poly(A) polymerase